MNTSTPTTEYPDYRYTRHDGLFSVCADAPDVSIVKEQKAASSTIRELQRNLQESVAIREDQLSVLNALMVKMMTYQALDPLLQHIAETMIARTVATNALILLIDETEEFIQVVASAGSHSARNIGQRRQRGTGFAGLAWETGCTQYISDSDTNEKTRGFWPSGTQLLAEPLVFDGEVIGVAVLGTSERSVDFSVSGQLINNLASLAGIAIANAQSLEQSRAELVRMRALGDISKQLMMFDTFEELLESVTRALVDSMDINRSSGHRVNDVEQLVAEAGWLKLEGEVVPHKTLSDELTMESIGGWCFRTREFASVLRNEKDPRVSTRIHALRDELNLGATLCMPICSGKRVVGLLTVSRNRDRRNFHENEINLFCSIVNQVSIAFVAKEMSDALQHQVNQDSLTQLPNRRCFERELQADLESSATAGKMFAVLFLDLDGFKSVNDTMGHASGDQLLQQVASRLRQALDDEHLLARIGGDEFAVVARQLIDRQQAVSVAFRLRKSLQEPFVINATELTIGSSIGLSFYPGDSGDADELLLYADEAMYKAKSSGEPRIVCFHKSMALATSQRCEVEFELRQAIVNQEFELYYQPCVNVERGCVDSVEALIRWNHPTKGLVSQDYFIHVAEQSGLINIIGSWVLSQVIRQLALWQHTTLAHLRVGVHIASAQFLEADFCDDLLSSLSQAGVCATHLEIEVTESVVMKDVDVVIMRLNKLRSAGIRVVMDDFGTGYSSLTYLRDLPLDTLKIDRAFMRAREAEHIDHLMVNTIVLMAQGLGLNTIAEDVTSQIQLDQLVASGCTVLQGSVFAGPGRTADLQATIDDIHTRLHARSFPGMAQLRVVGR